MVYINGSCSFFFFFFKQKTAYEMRISDWSSDVCSSDLELIAKWMSINGRANMVNTWLNEWNEADNCIHGKLFVADTLRLRHQAPNTANVPAVRVKAHKDPEGRVIRKEVLYGNRKSTRLNSSH